VKHLKYIGVGLLFMAGALAVGYLVAQIILFIIFFIIDNFFLGLIGASALVVLVLSYFTGKSFIEERRK
jgi:hypothetical protein